MRNVLLLNASFEPLRVITTKRAVCLVLSDKAEVLEAHPNGRLRSAGGGVELAAPAVVRLRNFVQIPFRATMPLTRRALLARDDHVCQVAECHRAGTTVDHVIPRARGGKHRWENVVAMCSKHNFTKSDKLLKEIGWTLKREPRVPHGTMWLFIAIGIEPEESWLPYIGAVA